MEYGKDPVVRLSLYIIWVYVHRINFQVQCKTNPSYFVRFISINSTYTILPGGFFCSFQWHNFFFITNLFPTDKQLVSQNDISLDADNKENIVCRNVPGISGVLYRPTKHIQNKPKCTAKKYKQPMCFCNFT